LSTADPARPLRADARRNHDRLLEVADAVFAERGVAATSDEIARAAGVGIGTVFRHFPTKEALLTAVYQARLQRLAARAAELATADDPGAAFFDYFRAVVEQSGQKAAIADALVEAGVDVRAEAGGFRFRDAFEVLLRRAQAAGAVRGDIGVPELIALLVGASRAMEQAETEPVRARTLAIVLDGLKHPTRERAERPSDPAA
jgi:AcrR family transcriptional regulator